MSRYLCDFSLFFYVLDAPDCDEANIKSIFQMIQQKGQNSATCEQDELIISLILLQKRNDYKLINQCKEGIS